MIFIEGGKVSRKFRSETCARETPVVLVLMAGLQTADDQIIDPAAAEDAEPVYEGCPAERTDFPIAILFICDDDDLCLQGIIRRIKPVCGQKLSVRTRNRRHGHDSARLFPYSIQKLAVL